MKTSQLRISIDSPSQRDHALDEVALAGAGELVQHDHVAAVRVVQAVRELVDEHPVAGVQRRQHRLALDDEVGEQERPHHDRHEQGDADDHDPVDERPCRGRQCRRDDPRWNPGRAGLRRADETRRDRCRGGRRCSSRRANRSGQIRRSDASAGPRRAPRQSDSISFSTRSSRLLNGSLHSTVRCA